MKRETYETMFIPDELDAAVKKGLEDGKKLKRKMKRKTIISIGGSIAAGVALFITICVANPTLASYIPFVDRIFEKVEGHAVFNGDYSEYSTHLSEKLPEVTDSPEDDLSDVYNEPSNSLFENSIKQMETLYGDTDQNITVVPEEVYCDGSSLYIGLRMTLLDGNSWGMEAAKDDDLKYSMQMIGNCDTNGEQHPFSNWVTIGVPEKSDILVGMIKLPVDGLLESDVQIKINVHTICWYDWNKYYKVLGTAEEEKRPWYHVLTGNWNLTVPVTIDNSRTEQFQIHECNEQGYGIESVNITPYEIQVKAIKPAEDAEQFQGAFAVFNENGEYFNWAEEGNGFDCYIVDEKSTDHLYFYYFKDEIEAFKCKDQSVAENSCIYKYELGL